MLPAAGFVDGLAAPHAGGAVEVEEDAGAGAAAVLEDEVAVEEDGFDLGEEAVVAIEVRPAGLDHADAGFGEVVDDAAEPGGGRDEVGVEDGDELALGGAEAFFEGAGFVAVAVGAVEVVDGLGARPWVPAAKRATMAEATPTVSSVESSRSWISKRSRG